MKRILNTIVFALCSLLIAQAELVQPVKWSVEEIGDSVRLKAAIEPGWHMTIIEFGEREFEQEFIDSFVITLAATELTPIRFNACDDKMCTAPEVWEWKGSQPSAVSLQPTGDTDARSPWQPQLLDAAPPEVRAPHLCRARRQRRQGQMPWHRRQGRLY